MTLIFMKIQNSFSLKWLFPMTNFEIEANSNSEMGHFIFHLKFVLVLKDQMLPMTWRNLWKLLLLRRKRPPLRFRSNLWVLRVLVPHRLLHCQARSLPRSRLELLGPRMRLHLLRRNLQKEKANKHNLKEFERQI